MLDSAGGEFSGRAAQDVAAAANRVDLQWKEVGAMVVVERRLPAIRAWAISGAGQSLRLHLLRNRAVGASSEQFNSPAAAKTTLSGCLDSSQRATANWAGPAHPRNLGGHCGYIRSLTLSLDVRGFSRSRMKARSSGTRTPHPEIDRCPIPRASASFCWVP